jgi:type IV secretory pathway VirB10-like protein
MKTMLKIAVVGTALVLMLIADIPFLHVQMVPEAHAVLGTRRRTRRRTAVVVGSSVHAADSAQTAQAQQQTAAAQQQAATAEQQAAAAKQEAAAAEQEAAAAKQEATTAKQQAAAAASLPPPPPAALPLGTVVAALPAGCTSTPVGGVEYYQCGPNYYRAVFQGNQLVYVTAKP